MASSGKEPSDEEMRKLLKPNPSEDQVVAALKESYAESGQEVKIVKELESYDDKNFWVEINGTPFLAKVHNGVESKDFLKLWKEESAFNKSVIHLQNAIMEHLNNHGISSSKPQKPIVGDSPTPASVHSLPVVSAEHSPCELVVRLLAWVPGRTMESFKTLPLETLADAGRFLGKLSHTLSSLESDEFVAAKRYHQWDGKNTQDLKNFVDCIKDPRRRSMVESVVQAFTTDLIDSKVAEQFPKSLIHGDFNDANILLDDDCLVSGVIDFGDSVERYVFLLLCQSGSLILECLASARSQDRPIDKTVVGGLVSLRSLLFTSYQ
jgi:Ser/Thr protein kinase RdoA (MazF antagonist)